MVEFATFGDWAKLLDPRGKIADFERWTKTGTSLADISEMIPGRKEFGGYLAGEEGWLPDWHVTGAGGRQIGLKEIGEAYKDPAMYEKGMEMFGERIRGGIMGFTGGLLGPGAKIPEIPAMPEFPKIEFPEIVIPEFPKIPEIPAFPEIPKIDIPTIDLTPFAAGLAAMGAGIGEGLGVDTSLTDEEGKPNMMLIAALAAAGLGALYILKR